MRSPLENPGPFWARIILRAWLVLLAFFSGEGLVAQDVLSLRDKHIAEPIGQYLLWALLPAEAQPFTQLDKNQLNLQANETNYFDAGFAPGRVVIRLDIQNPGLQTRRIFLEHRDVFVPSVRLIEEASGHAQLATLDSSQGDFNQNYHLHVFQLDVKPGANRYWIELEGIPKRLKLYLWDQQSFMSRGLHEHTLLMMFMAFPLVLIFYELLLFFTHRDRLRLFYILGISLVWLSSFISTGTIRMVLPRSTLPWIFTHGIYSTYLLGSSLVTHFIIMLFNTRLGPRLRVAYSIWLVTVGLTLALIQFIPFNGLFIYIVLAPLAAIVITMLAMANAIRHRHPHAYYLALGAAPGIAGNLYSMALLVFKWPLFSFQELSVPVGITAFAIGLSLAMGKETRLREEASAKKIDQLNQDLRLHILNIEDIVAAKTAKIQSIMENIKQGIFTINRNLGIDPEHSTFLQQILQASRIDSDPIHLLYEGTVDKQDEMDKIRSAILVVLGEPRLAFDLNQSAFPTEIPRQLAHGETQILECEWSPILDLQGMTDRILVCIRDVTETRKLLMQTARQTENSQILSELLGVEPMLFQRFMQQAAAYELQCDDYRRLIEAGRNASLNELLISSHTLKGLARSLNLGLITEVIHRIESELAASSTPPSFLAFHNLLERYRQMSENILSSQRSPLQNQHNRAEMEAILQNFRQLAPPSPPAEREAWQAVKMSLEALCLVPVDGFIDEAQASVRRLARDLQKPEPAFDVTKAPLLLTPIQDVTLRNIFLHLIRNAMDHGIEAPDVRRRLGKNPAGRLTLSIQDAMDSIVVEFSDDGQGLLVDRLLQGAIAKGAIPADAQLTQAEIAELMFLPGLSTAETISDISGRGIGMYAVRKMMEDIGGTITIVLKSSPAPTVPFSFRIAWPRHPGTQLEQAA